NQRHERQRPAKSKNQSGIAARAAGAYRARPARQLLERLGERADRQPRFDYRVRQMNSVAGGGDAVAEDVVVGEIIDPSRDPADFRDLLFASRDGCAQSEAHTLEPSRKQDLTGELRTHAQCFETRDQSLPRHATIEARYQPNALVP